jgi:hypothetical protein
VPKDAQQSGKDCYRAEFSQVEDLFAHWTQVISLKSTLVTIQQEQKVAALWKLVIHQLNGPEERWELLNR